MVLVDPDELLMDVKGQDPKVQSDMAEMRMGPQAIRETIV